MAEKRSIDEPGGLKFTVPGITGLEFRALEATVLVPHLMPWKGWAVAGRPARATKNPDGGEYSDVLLFVHPKAGRELDGWCFMGLANDSEYDKHWLLKDQIDLFGNYVDMLLKEHDLDVLCGS